MAKRTKMPGLAEKTIDTRQKVYIGIDNGVTGTIGIILGNDSVFVETPVFKQQNYTKKKANISRIDVVALKKILEPYQKLEVMVLLERPMVNPKMLMASFSAVRALEATLGVIELLGYSYDYIDSKEWQKALLPKGSKGPQLKEDSVSIACRLFSKHTDTIVHHKDGDGILIAEYCRRKF